MQPTYKKKLSGFILGLFIISQVLGVSSALLMPKQAEAFGPSFTVGDIPRIIYQIAEAAGISIATNLANKFLSRFISELDNKYKIRNYLYYDQILTNYYLSNYISDKIQDPDLRQIYGLLYSGFVSGQSTGTLNAPNPNNALIPKLNAAINKYYQANFGVPENVITSNPNNLSGFDYYSASFSYFLNPPSYVAQNLRGQFGAFQSSATTAAQLEVIVGSGLKAGRIVGGTCSLGSSVNNGGGSSLAPNSQDSKKISDISNSWFVKTGLINVARADLLPSTPANQSIPITLPPATTPSTYIEHQTDSPATCEAAGGTWQPSALDNARSFIDNPAGSINKWLTGAVQKYLDTNYNPNNYKAVIGSLLGNFLFKQFTGTNSSAVLVEDPRVSAPTDPNVTPGKELDIDGDKIPDGMDIDGDGQLDICYYGGVPDPATGTTTAGPPCQGSMAALTGPPATPVPCTQLGTDEQNFMLPLLQAIPLMNPVTSPPPQSYIDAVENVVNQTNQHFNLPTGQGAAYQPGTNTIGLPEFYAAGPTDKSDSPSGWGFVSRCTGTAPTPTGPTCQTSPNWQACKAPDGTDLVIRVRDYVVNILHIDIGNNCGAFEIVKRVAWVLRGEGAGYTHTYHSSACSSNGFSGDFMSFPDGSGVDILHLGATNDTTTANWFPGPGPFEGSNVYYVAPTDPRDPAGSY